MPMRLAAGNSEAEDSVILTSTTTLAGVPPPLAAGHRLGLATTTRCTALPLVPRATGLGMVRSRRLRSPTTISTYLLTTGLRPPPPCTSCSLRFRSELESTRPRNDLTTRRAPAASPLDGALRGAPPQCSALVGSGHRTVGTAVESRIQRDAVLGAATGSRIRHGEGAWGRGVLPRRLFA